MFGDNDIRRRTGEFVKVTGVSDGEKEELVADGDESGDGEVVVV